MFKSLLKWVCCIPEEDSVDSLVLQPVSPPHSPVVEQPTGAAEYTSGQPWCSTLPVDDTEVHQSAILEQAWPPVHSFCDEAPYVPMQRMGFVELDQLVECNSLPLESEDPHSKKLFLY